MLRCVNSCPQSIPHHTRAILHYVYFNVQEERAELREACASKDAQITALKVELCNVPQLKEELQQARVSEGDLVMTTVYLNVPFVLSYTGRKNIL